MRGWFRTRGNLGQSLNVIEKIEKNNLEKLYNFQTCVIATRKKFCYTDFFMSFTR
jgi:hypothetical protein